MRLINICSTPSPFSKTCATSRALRIELGDPNTLKPGQQAFLRQYMQLGPLYTAFTSTLAERKQGMPDCWHVRQQPFQSQPITITCSSVA